MRAGCLNLIYNQWNGEDYMPHESFHMMGRGGGALIGPICRSHDFQSLLLKFSYSDLNQTLPLMCEV